MRRWFSRMGVRDRLLLAVLATVAVALVTMTVVFNFLLATSLDSDVDQRLQALATDTSRSILITLYLSELGVKHILTKAVDEDHGKILTRVGAREIIEPEKAQAIRTAKGLSTPNLIDFLPLEQDYSRSQLAPPRKLVGKSLAESELRNRYHVYVIAIKETVPDNFVMLPPADFVIKDSDILVLVGRQVDIEKLGELI